MAELPTKLRWWYKELQLKYDEMRAYNHTTVENDCNKANYAPPVNPSAAATHTRDYRVEPLHDLMENFLVTTIQVQGLND
ncbi:hypothetical protein VNO78_03273 [Psophocarpus tetragonolobus]|uniref:Uncharacterized protein n=1 Tax=Psophocarpus tetragonolobus TaxID=3891 RepID=A0AAN9T0A4_PSOTE